MKSGLLSGIGKSLTDAAGIAQWYYGEKKEDDRYKEQKGLLAQEKAEKDKRYYAEIVGQTEDGRPVTRGMLSGKEYDGPLFDKLPRSPGEIYVDENNNVIEDISKHKGKAYRAGTYGAKGSTGETDLLDEKRFNEIAATTLGVEDFALGRRFKGDPPDQKTIDQLSQMKGERLVVQTDTGGVLGRKGYVILPQSVVGKGESDVDVDLTIGDDAPGLDMSKVKKEAKAASAKKEKPVYQFDMGRLPSPKIGKPATSPGEQKKAAFMAKYSSSGARFQNDLKGVVARNASQPAM